MERGIKNSALGRETLLSVDLEPSYLLFHPGSTVVSNNTVETFIYRLFAIDLSLGDTALELK